MRKLLVTIVLICASALTSYAQQDKPKMVAVWNTRCLTEGVSRLKLAMVQGGIEEAVDNTPGFTKYDRAASDAIAQEQNFQQSGVVRDSEIKEFADRSGAQYIIVPEVSAEENYFLIVVRILNVESGQSKTAQELCESTAPEIKKACANLAARLLGNNSTTQPRPSDNTTTVVRQDFTETEFGINLRMIYVEGGTFTMGCTSEQGSECENDESPNRQTTVSSYYIGMMEVTQSQWEKVMGTSIYQQRNRANENSTYGTGDDYPMYYVSWAEAKEFCARLSRKTGKTYRLPYEAEWEYASRGGKKNEGTKYSGSNSINNVAWFEDNSIRSNECGTKRANALGIYDMTGNLWEWCEDWYMNGYSQYDKNNPKGANSGYKRVMRGGSWCSYAYDCRVANRYCFEPDTRHYNVGFRIVMIP